MTFPSDLSRRHLLLAALAAGAAAATPARASKMPEGWTLPPEYMPRLVRLSNDLDKTGPVFRSCTLRGSACSHQIPASIRPRH